LITALTSKGENFAHEPAQRLPETVLQLSSWIALIIPKRAWRHKGFGPPEKEPATAAEMQSKNLSHRVHGIFINGQHSIPV
jgi:hypothetical protein